MAGISIREPATLSREQPVAQAAERVPVEQSVGCDTPVIMLRPLPPSRIVGKGRVHSGSASVVTSGST